MLPMSTPRAGPVCHFCRQLSRCSTRNISSTSAASPIVRYNWSSQSSQPLQSTSNTGSQRARRQPLLAQPIRRERRTLSSTASTVPPSNQKHTNVLPEDLATFHARAEELALAIFQHPGVPTEDQVLSTLREYESIVHTVQASETSASSTAKSESGSTATSALLSSVKRPHSAQAVTKSDLLAFISDRALDIVLHGPVFITTPLLQVYISLQTLLGRPESFPAVLDLYRSKPVPRPTKTQPIVYREQNPNKASAAVPPAVADAAINAAILAQDLPLALATIDTTYSTVAYKRAKFLRSALLPIVGLVLTPPAAYTLATRFSDWQTTMDSSTATQMAMAGILTYTTAVSTVGYVALTTANDQMIRVTWATGLPLWERWVREEERAALDKVAQAWGFKSRDRWGEEEGDEWDALREFIGLRGMMLDRVELMDGME